MVQSINTKAIMTLASVLRRPSLLIPHFSVATISDIDFAKLHLEMGVKAVVFDKDHTLTMPYVNDEIHPMAQQGLDNCLQVFGHDNVAILSNSAGTNDDLNFEQAATIEASLRITVIRHANKKPGGIEEVKRHFQERYNTNQMCVVGDRLLTDVVFGNLYDMVTIHTQAFPRSDHLSDRDNWTARWIRPMENYLIYRPRRDSLDGKRRLRTWISPRPILTSESSRPSQKDVTTKQQQD
jgi:phosphatidylglycerophosphatase GEP4